MAKILSIPAQSQHLVVIVGGAVAGSEAASVCAEHGVTALVLEQNARPFGKIEDGLPRWHDKLRQKEYSSITENLLRPGVHFVPNTVLGRDVSLEELVSDWKVSAVMLASGAWRDRPLFEGADAFLGKGLVYQNSLVYWYNHYPEEHYAGPRHDVVDGTVVVGGGLASIDVVKILSLELYKKALGERGIHVTTLELEHQGIEPVLKAHGLSSNDLGLRGVTLYYRREKEAMPLAQAPEDATPQQLEKVALVRAKLMDKVIERYLVRFEPNHRVEAPIVENERLVGLRFQRTRTVDGKLRPVEGGLTEVRAPLIVSSIGSIPAPIPGVPMRGELIDFEDWTTGKVRGFDNVFGLGNALTGKGNIKDSRKNAAEVSSRIADGYLGAAEADALEPLHDRARAAAERSVELALERPQLDPATIANVFDHVRRHWARVGYEGDLVAWLSKHARPVLER